MNDGGQDKEMRDIDKDEKKQCGRGGGLRILS